MSPLATAAVGNSNQGGKGTHGKMPGISVPTLGREFSADQNKGLENVGKGLETRAQGLAKKQTAENGSANPAIAAAIAAYRTARESAITSFQTATKGAREAFKAAISPAEATHKAAIDAARSALETALQSATTDQTKESAKDAFKAAVKGLLLVWLTPDCEDFGSHWKDVDYAEALSCRVPP